MRFCTNETATLAIVIAIQIRLIAVAAKRARFDSYSERNESVSLPRAVTVRIACARNLER